MRCSPRHGSWRAGLAATGLAALLLAVGCSGRPEATTAAIGRPNRAPLLAETPACASPDCNPNGAHAKHTAYRCLTCHKMHGPSRFDPAGPAFIAPTPANPTPPPPTFDPATVTCSSVACHVVPAGSFTFYFVGGDGEAEPVTVPYGGTSATTSSWYSTGSGTCGACHGNPPRAPDGGVYVWHSGTHAGGGPASAANQCQFCHPDASGSNGVGTTVTNPALHRNGLVEVRATFKSSCFGCH